MCRASSGVRPVSFAGSSVRPSSAFAQSVSSFASSASATRAPLKTSSIFASISSMSAFGIALGAISISFSRSFDARLGAHELLGQPLGLDRLEGDGEEAAGIGEGIRAALLRGQHGAQALRRPAVEAVAVVALTAGRAACPT